MRLIATCWRIAGSLDQAEFLRRIRPGVRTDGQAQGPDWREDGRARGHPGAVGQGRDDPGYAVARIDPGTRIINEILDIVRETRLHEAAELSAATAQARSDLIWSRLFTGAGAILNIGLVLLAMRLRVQRAWGAGRARLRICAAKKRELENQVADGPGVDRPVHPFAGRVGAGEKPPHCPVNCMTNSAACWWSRA